MKYIILAAAVAITVTIGLTFLIEPTDEVDQRTKELCHEYAIRDHEKELAPERWQWFLDQGINPNTDFDWYQSCLDHTNHPVAGQ